MRFEQLNAIDSAVLQCGVLLRRHSVATARFFKSLFVEEDFGVAAVLPGVPAFSSVWLKSRVTEELLPCVAFYFFSAHPISVCSKAIVRKLDRVILLI